MGDVAIGVGWGVHKFCPKAKKTDFSTYYNIHNDGIRDLLCLRRHLRQRDWLVARWWRV
jgi:hypothetical protein